jgi:hypoxanthine phosphoribosyltransferase
MHPGTHSSSIKRYTWEAMASLCQSAADYVQGLEMRPTVIVGILRGGCFPALMLSHALGLRRVYMLHVRTTLTDEPRSPRHPPHLERAWTLPRLSRDVVLLVDDVTNTGVTLRKAQSVVESRAPRSLVSVCLVWDTVPPQSKSQVPNCAANYYAAKIDAWAEFPWERQES